MEPGQPPTPPAPPTPPCADVEATRQEWLRAERAARDAEDHMAAVVREEETKVARARLRAQDAGRAFAEAQAEQRRGEYGDGFRALDSLATEILEPPRGGVGELTELPPPPGLRRRGRCAPRRAAHRAAQLAPRAQAAGAGR